MLADLNVVQLRSLSQAAQDLYILASPQSPMRDLLASAARQLTLSVPPERSPGTPAPDPTASGEGQQPSAWPALFGSAAQAGQVPAPAPGHEIDEHYRAAAGSGRHRPGRADRSGAQAAERGATAARQDGGGSARCGAIAAAPATGIDPALALRAEAQRQPQPLCALAPEHGQGDAALRSGSAKQQIVSAYNAAGGPAALCALAVNGRYPFVPASASDTPLDDFAQLFAPGGLLDGYYNTQLSRM